MNKKECRFYLKYGRCSHKDAPRPNHSRCVGTKACEVAERKSYPIDLALVTAG